MLRNAKQNSRLHLLLSQLGISKEGKQDLVLSATKGRTSSSAEMEVMEAQSLINWLAQEAKAKLRQKYPQPVASPEDRMRKKILSICHDLAWENKDGKVDWDKLNAYLIKYGYLHKSLHLYKYKELPTLVTQFENLLKHHYQKIENGK